MARAKKALKVDSKDKIPELEKLLKNGVTAQGASSTLGARQELAPVVTFVLIYADWCGHCHKYMDNVWNPMCKKGNTKHNVAAVREDVLPNTSLANAKIEGYPSVIVVNSDGKPAEFKKPDGEVTNAMPNKDKIEEAVNSPITESIVPTQKQEEPTVYPNNMPPQPANIQGKTYKPTPYPQSGGARSAGPLQSGAYAPSLQSGGGLLFHSLKNFSFNLKLKSRKNRKSKHRKTRRH
jgi:hypothetical protein